MTSTSSTSQTKAGPRDFNDDDNVTVTNVQSVRVMAMPDADKIFSKIIRTWGVQGDDNVAIAKNNVLLHLAINAASLRGDYSGSFTVAGITCPHKVIVDCAGDKLRRFFRAYPVKTFKLTSSHKEKMTPVAAKYGIRKEFAHVCFDSIDLIHDMLNPGELNAAITYKNAALSDEDGDGIVTEMGAVNRNRSTPVVKSTIRSSRENDEGGWP